MTTHVHIFMMRIPPDATGDLLGEASASVDTSLAGCRGGKARIQSLLVRRLMWYAIRRLFACGETDWRLEKQAGRPVLIGEGAPHVSFSHTRELVACVLANRPVGLDVECLKDRDFEQMARFICSAEEWADFQLEPESLRAVAFYRLWTLKEATFKAVGGTGFPDVSAGSEAVNGRHLSRFNWLPCTNFVGGLAVLDADVFDWSVMEVSLSELNGSVAIHPCRSETG